MLVEMFECIESSGCQKVENKQGRCVNFGRKLTILLDLLLETYFFRPTLILLNAVPPKTAEDSKVKLPKSLSLAVKIGSLSFVPMIKSCNLNNSLSILVLNN